MPKTDQAGSSHWTSAPRLPAPWCCPPTPPPCPAPWPGTRSRRRTARAARRRWTCTATSKGCSAASTSCSRTGTSTEISDIVLSSQWHSIVALDDKGERADAGDPVGGHADRCLLSLGSVFDEHAFHARTGAWLHRLYWTRRIPWLCHCRPGCSAYAGPAGPGAGAADRRPSDLCFDRLRHRHSGPRVRPVRRRGARGGRGLGRADLPPIVPTGWTGALSPEYARRWPGLVGVPVHPPTGDGAASNVGTGAYDETTAAVTVGTSAAVRVVHPIDGAPELPWELWRYRVDDKRAVTGMAFSAAGNLHAWLTGVLQLDEEHREPTGVEIGSSRVIAIPFQAGTRPPETVPGGSGVYFGLSFDDTGADLLAASLQGASLEIDRGLRMLDSLFGRQLRDRPGRWRDRRVRLVAPLPDRDLRPPDDGLLRGRGRRPRRRGRGARVCPPRRAARPCSRSDDEVRRGSPPSAPATKPSAPSPSRLRLDRYCVRSSAADTAVGGRRTSGATRTVRGWARSRDGCRASGCPPGALRRAASRW